VVVAGVGARTAVGMTAPGTAAAVRAGVAGFEKHPFAVDTVGNPMIVAAAPYLGPDVAGAERFAELAGPAAAEALAAFAAVPGGKAAGPVLGRPAAGPSRPRERRADNCRHPRAGGAGPDVPSDEGRADRDWSRRRCDGGERRVGRGPVRRRRVRPGRRGGFVP